MSMSTSVTGFRPPDARWRKMKAVWDACLKAEIPIPDDVSDFFESGEPDEKGVEVDLEEHGCAVEWNAEAQSGYEVFVDKIPAGVKVIRFFNSW